MRGAIVTLDIETTGLDPKRDHIIEIGAVRSENGAETAAFQTFVNPGIPIPPFVSDLTGIHDANVAGAPRASEALSTFADFVGATPVLAHNARFDMTFLRTGGILKTNQVLDSVELAVIMLPRAQRYGLGALADLMGISLENAHRALEDARATSELYWLLWERACALPENVLREMCQHGKGLRWAPALFFEAALEAVEAGEVREFKRQAETHPCVPNRTLQNPNRSIIVTLKEAFRAQEHLLLETGELRSALESSVIAAAGWANEQGERVVLAAREQNSLPSLCGAARRLAAERQFRWAELAVPADYLCRQAWIASRSVAPLDADELQFRARILVWLAQSGNGNRRQLRLRGPVEKSLWRRISGEHCNCQEEDACAWRDAQRGAENAQLILTSLANWWTGVDAKERFIPSHGAVILFDAAQLEDVLSETKALRLDKECVTRTLRALTDAKVGLFDQLIAKGLSESFAEILRSSLRSLIVHLEELFSALAKIWDESDLGWLSLTPERRRRPVYQRVLLECRRFHELGEEVVAALDRLAAGLSEREDTDSYAVLIRGLMYELRQALMGFLRGILSEGESEERWLERSKWTTTPQYCTAPLRPGHAFSAKMSGWGGSLILQDTVISSGDDGKFWRERFSSSTLIWRSITPPENDRVPTLVHIPQDIPPPNERAAYQRAFERCLLNLVSESNGRTIALFTSFTHLRETARALRPRLHLGRIRVFEGNQTSEFLVAERGLFLITWREFQKLALPAGSSSIAVLARLPFDLPSVPLVAARASEYGNGFNDFSLPIAIRRMLIMLRQTQMMATGRCAFVVADSRIIRKRYGEKFLGALPAVELRYGESVGVGSAVNHWLQEEV